MADDFLSPVTRVTLDKLGTSDHGIIEWYAVTLGGEFIEPDKITDFATINPNEVVVVLPSEVAIKINCLEVEDPAP